mgnify:FL=1
MKIVINNTYGGFSLSKENFKRYCEIKGIECWIEDDKEFTGLGLFTVWTVSPEERMEIAEGDSYYKMSKELREEYNKLYQSQTLTSYDISRNDPALVQLVEEDPGQFGKFSNLKIVEIPDDVEWTIEEYDGNEWVAEVHRCWS